MKKINPSILLITAVIVFITSCRGTSEYFGWRGPERDGKIDGFTAPAEWPASLTKAWQTNVGLGDASPILVKEKLYLHVLIDSLEQALCLGSETGEILWQTNINPAPEVTGGARTHPGPRSTPAYHKGKIFTVGVGGVLSCLDAENGQIIWNNTSYTHEVPKFYAAVSPLIINNMVIVHLGGHDNGVIIAFDADSGNEIWKISGEPGTYSSPVIWKTDSEHILVQTETDLLGISFDGNILWKIPTPGERMFYNSSTPVYDGNRHFISGQGNGTTAYEVKQTDGEYKVDSLWNNPDYGVSFCTPVIKNGYIYGNDKRMGYLYALNANTGETAWADTVKHNRFAAMFDLGNVLLSQPASAELIFFEPSPTEYIELARYKISETEVYASPIISGDLIFTKDKETLTCWITR